jgi:hypothetical protein
MKRLALLPILTLALACSDDGILQPEPAVPPDVVMAARPFTPANGGLEFTVVGSYVTTLAPGTTRITPGGVMLIEDYSNLFDVTGDLEGSMIWTGNVHTVLDKLAGPALGQTVVLEISKVLGEDVSGNFVCRSNGLSIGYGTADFTYHGKMIGCAGHGDFDGMHLKADFAVRTGGVVYDVTGVIW